MNMIERTTSARRRTRLLGITATLAVALGACSQTAPGSGGDASASPKGKFMLGHSYQNLSNQFFADELKAEKQLLESKGLGFVDAQAGDSPSKQVDDIATLIARQVNVLAIDAIDPDAIVPGLKAAADAKIPVVMLIRKPTSGVYASLVYLDSVQDGKNACKVIVDKLGGKGKVVNLTGPLQILAAKERAQGCDEVLKASPGITVVAEPSTDYSLRDAEQKMTDVIQAKGQIDAVFGGNDDIALGAVRALQAAGQDPTKKVIVGVDGTQSALKAICQGTMTQTMATFASKEAQLVAQLAQDIYSGKPVDKEILFPADPVNSSNVVAKAKDAGIDLGATCPAAGK